MSLQQRRHAVRLRDAAVRDADLLLYRRRHGDPAGLAICVAGRSDYSHVAMAGWDWDPAVMHLRLSAIQIVSFRGGCKPRLRDEVERWPGRSDWYQANPDGRWPEFDRIEAVARMLQFVGCRYGRWALFRVGLLHLPLIRWLVRPNLDDAGNGSGPPFCSHAVAIATRAGGVDAVRNLADRITEPGDLARSLFYRYAGTLVP